MNDSCNEINMKNLKIICSLCFLFIISVHVYAQKRTVIRIPNLPGYQTLKCDFHTHTVFSDGRVWPDVRIEEAWEDGLDVIALTDHINYKSPIIRKYLKCDDENAAYDEGVDTAVQLGITLIKGAEINMPRSMGHFNVLFLDDLNDAKVTDKDFIQALRNAKDKGAFIQWNHPLSKWGEVHEQLYKEGLLDGLEIYNFNRVYPNACQWADEKRMTVTAGSDIHYLIDMKVTDSHRPMTLVFAKENTVESIKEAMKDRRTAVYFADTIVGRMEYLEQLFNQGVSVEYMARVSGKKNCYMHFTNNTDIPFTLELVKGSKDVRLPRVIYLGANGITQKTMSYKEKNYIKKDTFLGKYRVRNFRTPSGKNLEIELHLENTNQNAEEK